MLALTRTKCGGEPAVSWHECPGGWLRTAASSGRPAFRRSSGNQNLWLMATKKPRLCPYWGENTPMPEPSRIW